MPDLPHPEPTKWRSGVTTRSVGPPDAGAGSLSELHAGEPAGEGPSVGADQAQNHPPRRRVASGGSDADQVRCARTAVMACWTFTCGLAEPSQSVGESSRRVGVPGFGRTSWRDAAGVAYSSVAAAHSI
jgi:hypothetical protein